MSTTNPTPQASCSNAGSYRPFGCGDSLSRDVTRPLSQTRAHSPNRMITSDACVREMASRRDRLHRAIGERVHGGGRRLRRDSHWPLAVDVGFLAVLAQI